ncbi:Rik1-associated factor 1 [Cytospora mali]|uniref:Rik1-associated factor 1 n=1 Tax=Cytospora mali TaxID=578113 RepID=A0A194V1D0_CYTMA|nr:Rik1-associated factor 1 [Valsa mali var. pyri (nom. inval.)]
MAAPTQRVSKEVIDLTGDDDNDTTAPPSCQPSNSANGPRLTGLRVGGHTLSHIYHPPAPHHTLNNGNPSSEPPAKRQRLSEAPRAKLSDGQHVEALIAAALSPYAKAAAEGIADSQVDKSMLRTEIKAALIRQFGLQLRLQGGKVSRALHGQVEARSKALAKDYAKLRGFRRHPLAETFPPQTAPSPAQVAPARTPGALANRPLSSTPASASTSAQPQATTTASTFNDLTRAAKPEVTKPPVARSSQSTEPSTSRVLRTSGRRSVRTKSPPASPRSIRTAVAAPTSPANFRSRAKVAAWKSEGSKTRQDGTQSSSSYFALEHRPYVDAESKEAILKRNGRFTKMEPYLLTQPEIFHVDFTLDEAREVQAAVRRALNKSLEDKKEDPYRDVARLLKKLKDPDRVARLAGQIKIEGRHADDNRMFFQDVVQKKALVKEPQILSIEKDAFDKREEDLRESRLSSLLLAREISGNRGFGMRRLENFTNEFHKSLEDEFELRAEFTNCAGDVSTVSWVSNTAYVAGTTVHMDSHNQQYNKPGNLLLGTDSPGAVALKAYPDHRIPRPLVQKGENSTDEMRESQDPWLYTSVVSSDYDPIHGRTYTSGFDRTVKTWKVDESGSSMACLGTWEHDGIVNFVQASKLKSPAGLVATASDVPVNAVRIYQVDPENISSSTYTSLSGSRIRHADGTLLITDKWAYFPSTMKWGIEESVKHLLLVGFSPRSLRDDDNDIPQDRLNTGELCLWNTLTGEPVRITSANSQNVFEVLWHPTQPAFIMASSPTGNNIDVGVRTQVRIFARTKNAEHGFVFSEIKALDCPAVDINELTMMPNSCSSSYVTAGCTDGKTYVWDSALSDKPIHTLTHGPPLEGVTVGDDEDDTGVKFTAWGTSPDRFYTGSSDGVVKVWSVRGDKKAKGKVLLEAPAQISYGAFSPDFSGLVIGDASGRVFLLSVHEDEEKPASFVNVPGARGTRRRPTPVTPHPEPPPPPGTLVDRQTGVSLGRGYLASRQLRYSGDRTVGMVQDVNYADTGLFRREAHAEYDPARPAMAHYECQRQENLKAYSNPPLRTRRLKKIVWADEEDDGDEMAVDGAHRPSEVKKMHAENCKLDAEFDKLSLDSEVRYLLTREGVGVRRLLDGSLYEDEYEYIDEVDENCKKGVVDRKKEEDNELGY